MQQDIVKQDLGRVLIISLGGMAEIAQNLSAIEAVRRYHTKAHIVLITEPEFHRFMSACPYVDEVVTNWRSKGLLQDLNATNTLQKAGFDMVYDFTRNEETAGIFKKFWVKKPQWSGVVMGCSHPLVDRSSDKMHHIDRNFEQLWLCGIGPTEGYPIGAAPLPDTRWILGKTDYHNVPKSFGLNMPYALLMPEAPAKRKNDIWNAERFAELGQILAKNGIKPVLIGSPKAIPQGNAIRGSFDSSNNLGLDDLIARVDIFQLAALARGASMVVGSNSGPLVLAGLIGAPTIAIINPDSANIRQVAPRGSLTVSLVARDFKDISAEQVINAARAVRD